MRLLLILLLILPSSVDAASQWIQRADFGGVGRHRAIGTSTGNKGYMGLGHINGTGVETYFSDWWEYDPATNSWTQKADYIGNNGNGDLGTIESSYGGKVYVGLGELDYNQLYSFDPSSNTWSFEAYSVVSSSGLLPIFQDTRSFTIGSKMYLYDVTNEYFFEYDMLTGTWTEKGQLPFPSFFVFSSFAIGGKGYIKDFENLWEYTPLNDSWRFIGPFPGYATVASLTFVQNNKGYIVCGYGTGNSDLTKEVWEFNPLTEGWIQLPKFPGSARRYSSIFTIDDRCFIGTGTSGTNYNDFWEFNASLSIEEELFSNLKVYPIPAREVVNFTNDNKTPFEISFNDKLGRNVGVLKSNNGKVIFKKGNLSSGQYFYKMTGNLGEETTGSFIFTD